MAFTSIKKTEVQMNAKFLGPSLADLPLLRKVFLAFT
jgi:hypothetical protein